MMRARRLLALAIVGVIAVGCGDAAPIVVQTREPHLASGAATSEPTAPAPPSSVGPTASPSRGVAQATPSASPTSGPDRTALRWAKPASISADAYPGDILFWQGTYIAIGSDGNKPATWTSPDLARWTRGSLEGFPLRDAGIGEPLEAPRGGLIALGVHGRLRCDVGEGATCDPRPIAIWTSADGRSWHGRAAPTVFAGATIAAVAAGPGGILVVGDTGWDHPAAWFSADGRSWSRERLPAALFRHAEFQGLTAYRGRWVLTGLTDPEQVMCCTGSFHARLKAAAWYSADGRSWKRASVESAKQETMFFADASPGGLVSGGFDTDWVSADGRSWRTSPRDPDIGAVASDGNRIIGVSQGDDDELELWVSTDGRSWQALTDAGDVGAKPSWQVAHDFYLLPAGLAIVGSDGSVWLARPTSAP
jgi:hypothetical protein